MSSFTPSQRQKIDHFKAVTNIQSDDIAYYALQKTNWDVTNCISLYFENPGSLLNRHSEEQNREEKKDREEEGESSVVYYASYIPGLVTLGSLITSMFGYITPYLSYMFGNAASLAYREILTQFKDKHVNATRIFVNTDRFGEIMNQMERNHNRHKCLFIFFNDANSSQCNQFVTNVLCEPSVIDYLSVNMVSYLGDERNIDGRQLFAQITHQFSDKRKPFVCIAGIHPRSHKLVLVHRQFVGNCRSPLLFIANILDHGLQRWQQFQSKAIQEQQLSQSNRYLREMQDREYQNALLQEQKTQTPTQTLQTQTQTGNDHKELIMNRMKIAKQKIDNLSSMIEKSSKDSKVKVALRLPNGARVQHIFCNQTLIQSLFDFALCHELKIDQKCINDFELVCSYPKRVFTQNDTHLTLSQAGIEHSTILFVQEII